MRTEKKLNVEDPCWFKRQLKNWAQQFEEVVWLDSNNYSSDYSSYDAILAVEAFTGIKTDHQGAFDQLQEYQELSGDWLFGYLSYDLKNDTEDLISANFDGLKFPEMYFFQPKKLFLLKGGEVEMRYLRMIDDEMERDLKEIYGTKPGEEAPETTSREEKQHQILHQECEVQENNCGVKARIPRELYLQKVEKVLQHIRRGDIYEANFCQEFYAEEAELDPLKTYEDLNSISNPPFATFLKFHQNYLFSASPERYLKKQGRKIVSQPIKGTARRAKEAEEDERLLKSLQTDPKEFSENVMIVDLVRNDLSKTAKKGSVEVEELCKVYTFRQVHQMISTIKAELEDGIPSVEVLRTTFPMGSMTGAPKIAAMQSMEDLEETKRGLYSGAVGYFTPEGDFDFNVVIRSILYNAETNYVSFSVGGAITSKSIPEKEYEECLIKAVAMLEVLENQLGKRM